MIEHEKFKNDYKERLKQALEKKVFISPFYLCIDNKGNICLFYSNRKMKIDEIYRYKLDGTFMDIYRYPQRTLRISCVSGQGKIYSVIEETKIGIFQIEN